jgi:hypothetical protein
MQEHQQNQQLERQVIFISGRFRSGTSMLWNVFNQLPQYTAWYEPLHPNLRSHIQYVKPKVDHIGIDNYWHNYHDLTNFEDYYSPDFGQSRLFLEKHEEYKGLKDYIQYLIDHSDGVPVLQFNRVDLRLSWLKNNFPQATIISIKREAYPLWISSRKHIQNQVDKVNESFSDAYDLMQWSVDLAQQFPMLQAQSKRHGYFRHYFIWKLTQMMAKQHNDLSLSLEKDFFHTQNGIEKLSQQFSWNTETQQKAQSLVAKPQSLHQKNTKDVPVEISDLENEIDALFELTGLNQLFPSSPLDSIKFEYKNAWKTFPYQPQKSINELLDAMRLQKDELTASIHSIN